MTVELTLQALTLIPVVVMTVGGATVMPAADIFDGVMAVLSGHSDDDNGAGVAVMKMTTWC